MSYTYHHQKEEKKEEQIKKKKEVKEEQIKKEKEVKKETKEKQKKDINEQFFQQNIYLFLLNTIFFFVEENIYYKYNLRQYNVLFEN